MVQDLESILKKLGWEDGFQIPVANAENQALEQELAKLNLLKIKMKNTFESTKQRLNDLRAHHKFITQENDQNQKLVVAHKQHLEAEENQIITTKVQKSSVNQELKQLEKWLEESDHRQQSKKDTLQRNIVKVEKLKVETKWDEEALNAWEEALNKRDEDIDTLKKFSKEDEILYNDLEAKRQILQFELGNKKQTVSKVLSNCINNETIIQRTGKMIKQLTTEREALINQWKDSVKILQQRDKEILTLQSKLNENKEESDRQLEMRDEQNQFLISEQKNNKKIENEIESQNIANSNLRKNLNELTNFIGLLEGELDVNKSLVLNAANTLRQEQQKSRQLSNETEKKLADIEELEGKLDKANYKLQELQRKSTSVSANLCNLENLIEYEQKQEKIYLAETERLHIQIFRIDNILKEQNDKGKSIKIKIGNNENILFHLKTHYNELVNESNNHKSLIYDLDYKINLVEQKLLDIEEIPLEDFEEIEKYMQLLENKVAELTEVRNHLQVQLVRIQDEMLRINNVITSETKNLDALKVKCEDGLLVQKKSIKQLDEIKLACQEKQVEENMLRLRVKNIERDVKHVQNNIFSLQKLEVGLEQAMRERKLEIDATKAILLAKRRNVQDDRGRLRADIVKYQNKIDQYRKKYDVEIIRMGEGHDDGLVSSIEMKLQRVQEKVLLKQEGDKLDNKVKKAEAEIVAMENTLQIVNLTNDSFKKSLGIVPDEDEALDRLESFNRELDDQLRILYETREDLKKIQDEIYEFTIDLHQAQKNQTGIKQLVDNLIETNLEIQKQAQSKGEKLTRTKFLLQKVTKLLKKVDKKFDRDFEIRQLRDGNIKVVNKLVNMAAEFHEMTPAIKRYANEYNVEIPEKKISPSISTFSSRSSLSSFKTTATDKSNVSLNKLTLQLKL